MKMDSGLAIPLAKEYFRLSDLLSTHETQLKNLLEALIPHIKE